MLIAVSFVLSGCAITQGTSKLSTMNHHIIARKIIKYQTTKSEVISMFGKPTSKASASNGSSVWTYQYYKSSANAGEVVADIFGAQQGHNKLITLKITFNKHNVVTSYVFKKTAYTQ